MKAWASLVSQAKERIMGSDFGGESEDNGDFVINSVDSCEGQLLMH